MALIDINLLSQQQSRADRLDEANVVVGVVTATIVGLLLLVFVFLLSTHAVRSAHKEAVIKETGEIRSEMANISKVSSGPYKDLTATQQVQAYAAQAEALSGLLDGHKYFSLYLTEIALNTPNTVVLNSFGIDGSDKLQIEGSAASYTDVAALATNFKNLTFVRDATIGDAKLTETVEGTGDRYPIKFTLTLLLKPACSPGDVEAKDTANCTIPPQLGSGAAKSSPRPSPSVRPSPTARPR